MDDFRFLEDNCLWIVVIIIFLLLLCGGNSCGGFNFDCLGNLFNGCGNSSWLMWLILIIIFCCCCKGGCGCIFRNDMQ